MEKAQMFKLTRLEKLAYGCGHILNDLCANCWFSYVLIFMTKVVNLSNAEAGLILLIGQAADALFMPFTGYACDNTKLRCYGKRKFWNLIGTLCVLLSFPFVFSLSLAGRDSSSTVKVSYYAVFVVIFQFGWGASQISHLSLIPVISKKWSDTVELNSIRSGLKFICGIFVFGVTWILLGTRSGEHINRQAADEFQTLAFIVCGTGLFFTILFHVGVKEKPHKEIATNTDNEASGGDLQKDTTEVNNNRKIFYIGDNTDDDKINKQIEQFYETIDKGTKDTVSSEKRWKDWLKDSAFYKTGFMYMFTRLSINVFQSFFVLYLTDALDFNKEAIAYFPLIVLIFGAFSSMAVKQLTKKFSNKLVFIMGAFMVMGVSVWLLSIPRNAKQSVYGAACLAGSGTSIMLVTALTMTADLIGDNQGSSAFVYAAMSLSDKMSTGAVIALVQGLKPTPTQYGECDDCALYAKIVQSVLPGGCAFIAALIVMIAFPSQGNKESIASTVLNTTKSSTTDKTIVECHTVEMNIADIEVDSQDEATEKSNTAKPTESTYEGDTHKDKLESQFSILV